MQDNKQMNLHAHIRYTVQTGNGKIHSLDEVKLSNPFVKKFNLNPANFATNMKLDAFSWKQGLFLIE
jgi:hypothetical protein